MSQFWILAVLLIILALMFLVEPLVRARRSRLRQQRLDAERQQQNIEIFRERLAELEADKAAGQLEEPQFQALRQELEMTLLNDVDGMSTDTLTREGRGMGWLSLGLAIIIPAVAIGLYFKWGAYDGVQQKQWLAQMEEAGAPDVAVLLKQLEQRLEENPDNPDGWFMLARSHMSLGDYGKAAEAFRRLAELLEPNPQEAATVYGLYAQALYFANQGRFDASVQQAIDAALQRSPDEINALGLLGIRAFEQARYGDAAGYWQRVLDLHPDSPNADTIRAGIARARELMEHGGQNAQSAPAPVGEPVAPDAATNGPALRVSVSLSPALAAQAAPEDTLFVYARAVEGSRMPLAIVRKQVADLPLEVTLDDSTAMGPMAKLSSAEAVEVIARVSKQGTPTPSSGDLEGMVAPVSLKPGAQSVQLEIATQLP